VVHGRVMGTNHKVNSDDDGAVLVSPNKLSDQPEILSKSCYGIFKNLLDIFTD